MKRFLIISFLSSFYIFNTIKGAAVNPRLVGVLPPLVLAQGVEYREGRPKSGRLSSLSGKTPVDSSTPTFERGLREGEFQELRFFFPKNSKKKESLISERETSLNPAIRSQSVVEVALQLDKAITNEVVLTGDRDGKPFLLVLAQTQEDESLLVIKVDPITKSRIMKGASFLPGKYISHTDNHQDGTVTIAMLQRLGNTTREIFITLGENGEVASRSWGKTFEYVPEDPNPSLRIPIDLKLKVVSSS